MAESEQGIGAKVGDTIPGDRWTYAGGLLALAIALGDKFSKRHAL